MPTERAAEVTSAVTQAFADTEYTGTGVQAVVDQQFEVGRQILAGGLVPILEPEIDIHSPSKAEAEQLLKPAILERLGPWEQASTSY